MYLCRFSTRTRQSPILFKSKLNREIFCSLLCTGLRILKLFQTWSRACFKLLRFIALHTAFCIQLTVSSAACCTHPTSKTEAQFAC